MGANLEISKKLQNYINDFGLKLHPVQQEIIDYNNTLGEIKRMQVCLLYTSPSPRDKRQSRMPSSA